ncbi:MAG: methionyl-tRNA formyltransferase [Candidatus Limnocylindrales bacterium]
MTTPARTIFLGSGAFAVPIGRVLLDHPAIDLVVVITAPTRLGSRGRPTDPPVARWAADAAQAMLRPARLRDPDAVLAIASLAPDLLVLADYGQIVPSALLELPSHGALNLHPSLLPRYRGASPISAAILAGDSETGVTLMRMNAGMDTGPIVAQVTRSLDGSETAPSLEEALAAEAADLVSISLQPWLNGEIQPSPQDHETATVTRPLKREDGRLDPIRTVAELERQVRAYQPWPGSYVDTSEGRLIVWRAHAARADEEVDAGVGLGTMDGYLMFDEVQLAGGRRMSSADLLRGRPELRGDRADTSAAASG